MLKQLVKILFIVFFFFIASQQDTHAQFFRRIFHKKTAAEKGEEAKRKKDAAESEKQAKLYKKALDYEKKLQTKEVRKRMKRSRKQTVTPFSETHRTPFYKRWFSKKHF